MSEQKPATVEGLMELVEQYVSAEIEWWDRKRGTTKTESDAIRAYAERLAAATELLDALEKAKEQLDEDCFTTESKAACLARVNRVLAPFVAARYSKASA